MTEKEKMLNSELYDAGDEELTELRIAAGKLCSRYNLLTEDQVEERTNILQELLGKGKNVFLRGPIYFDYGKNTEMGENCYANYNFCVLDCAKVTIGNNVFFGPNVCISTAGHPLIADERIMHFSETKGRLEDQEYARPISIGNNTWVGANVVILPGVTIGENCVIGAGSVVTRDIPSNSVAFGNPCRVHRNICEKDSMIHK